MARQIASGVGRNSGLTRPAPPASCHSTMTTSSAIQPPKRLAPGTKPAPRNSTGRISAAGSGLTCCGARSSMLNLAFGINRLVADQRPQLVLQRDQLAALLWTAALSSRHRHGDDLAPTSGAARPHHDAVGEPHRFLEIMGDIDRAHRAVRKQADEILH